MTFGQGVGRNGHRFNIQDFLFFSKDRKRPSREHKEMKEWRLLEAVCEQLSTYISLWKPELHKLEI
jgi:hypothetical protein